MNNATIITAYKLYACNYDRPFRVDTRSRLKTCFLKGSACRSKRFSRSVWKRLCKPGGDLIILNHSNNCNRLIRAPETMLLPFAWIIGFRPVFPMERFILESALDVVEISPVDAFRSWSLIHATKR